MKFLILFLLLSVAGYGQTTYYIQADSTRLRKIGANNELIIENATRTTTGVLVNYGNGRTRFSKPRINGDTLFVGVDTVLGVGAAGAAYTFPYSVVAPGNAVQLENDTTASPANYFYGRNAAGRRGWYLPTNIYNSDGTLTEDRSVDGGGNALFLQNIGEYILGANSIENNTADYIRINSKAGSFNQATINLEDSISLKAYLGKLNIDSLRSATDTATRKPMVWSPATGRWEYLTYWPGGSGATPGLQDVITQDATLTTDNAIDGGGFDLEFNDVHNLSIGSQGTNGTGVSTTLFSIGSAGNNSSIAIYPDSIIVFPHLGRLRIDTLNHSITVTDKMMVWDSASGRVATRLIPSGGGGLTIGTTAIASGTAGRVLFEGSGNVLQESANLVVNSANEVLIGGISDVGAYPLQVSGASFFDETINVAGGGSKGIRMNGLSVTNNAGAGYQTNILSDDVYGIRFGNNLSAFQIYLNSIIEQEFTVGVGVVFNEDGNDRNFRIETDGDANAFVVDGGLNAVGIGTASPAAQFHTTSTVRLAGIGGAGAVTSDADGDLSVTSDRRLKIIDSRLTGGLREILAMNQAGIPIIYRKIDKPIGASYAGLDALGVYEVIQQKLGTAVAEAVAPTNKEGMHGLNDRAIIGMLINAVAEQQKQIEQLQKQIKKRK